MEKLTSKCPSCSSSMEIERLRCTSCDVAVEGRIPIPRLARLPAEDREFVELFVRSSGSLKAVAEKMGISYPTIRSRLNRIIQVLEQEEDNERTIRHQILDEVEQGRIDVDEAVRRLREM